MPLRRQSLPVDLGTGFERMQRRIHRLPINVQDHGEHWRRIGDALKSRKPSNQYDVEVEEHLRQYANRLGKPFIESEDIRSDSKDTMETELNRTVSGSFVQTDATPLKSQSQSGGHTTRFHSGRSIFDRYTDFGGIASSRNGTGLEDEDSEISPELELDFASTSEATPTAIIHSTKELTKSLYHPQEHVKPRKFPDRQLLIYVVADPTGMRTELATLRLSVWPQLQRLCDSRGFSLQVIDRSVETDFNPPIDPDQEMEQISSELLSYLEQRTHENKFLNCLILLSNQNVGWLPTLPTRLPSDDVERIIEEAKKEVERIQDDIATQMANMPGSKSGHSMVSKVAPDRESSSYSNVTSSGLSDRSSQVSLSSDRSIAHEYARVEESIKRKTDLMHSLQPDPFSRWYRPSQITNTEEPRVHHLQPVRSILPDIVRFDEPQRRQNALDCWLKEAHIIRALLWRYWDSNTAGSRKNRPKSEQPSPVRNSTSSKWDVNDKSILEDHVQTILDQEAQNADCFVVIRCQEEDSESTSRYRKKSGSGNAYPRPISPATISTTRTREDTLHTARSSRYHGLNEVNQFLQLAMEASRMRAKSLMEYARLRVPQFNQIHYDLSGQTNTDVEEEILGRHNLVDPLSRADHAGYLEELVRNMHQIFEKSLQQEMDRRLTIEAELRSLSDCDNAANEVHQPLLWDLPYEIQAHQEACEEFGQNFIARNDILEDMIQWIQERSYSVVNKPPNSTGRYSLMFVRGASGSGKSVLLAKLARTLRDNHGKKTRVVYRHLGSSCTSMSLLQTLRYLCTELSARMSSKTLADTYDGLRRAFHQALIDATFEQDPTQSLVVILDGIENLEEFNQRGEDFPMAWIPIGWLQNKPLLNCDLVLILSGSACQDNNPFTQVGGLFDRINLPSWSQSNSNQTTATKLIHLGSLSHTDVQKCLDDLRLLPYSTSPGSHAEQMIFSGGLGPLELRLLIALIRQDRSEQALNRLREFSLTNLIQLWFNMAEQDYGRERVQLVVQNLVASRFGINWSDLVQWYTNKQAHVLRRPSQSLVKFAHRHSLTVRNANLWASGQLNKSNLTYSWWKRFSLIYLIPFGLLGCRRTGPHGSGRLTYLNHGIVRNALLMRYGPDVDSSLVPVHRSQAVWYTEQLAIRWCNPIAHGGYRLSIMDWRALLELPYQLAKSKQYKKLKLKCFYNIHWLREMLSIAYHGHDRYPSVQFLLDEITAQLCTVRSERVELLKAEMQTHPLPPTTLISRLDLFSFVAVQLMEDQPELMQLVGSLCCWRGQLKRDPDLIVPLCYMHFGFIRNDNQPRSQVGRKSDKNSDHDDLNAIEVEEDENPSHEDDADNMNLADSDDHFGADRDESPRQNWNKSSGSMLVQLLNQIDHKASDLILRPINYTLTAQSMTKILISANQTHAKSSEMSVWPKTSMEITALAYCPMNKNLLAIGLWNRQARTTSVEIWNISQDQMEWNQLTSSQTLGPISLIRWLADKALILVQTTRPVLTIWPVEIEQTWTDEFYELRTGSHGSSTGLSSEIPAVYVISTEDNRTCYIAVVYSGKEQIDLWSWDSSKVQYLGQSNTFGHWIHMPVVSALNEGRKARQLSLPVVIRPSSGELLVDMTHEKQYLRFVVAQRGTCTAYLFTAGPLTNPGHMDWSKPRALKCPPESTRIMAVACIHSRGLVTVATRTPRDEHIVGCLNLFDLNSGQLLEQIDGSAETFACTEFNLSSQGLLAYTVPPTLRFVLTDDQMRLFTISRKPIGQPVSSSFELIAWNLSTRVQRRLTDAELFPYLEQQHLTPLPIPADTCDLGSNDLLSVCFNMNAEMGSRLCYSDISVMLTRPIKLLKRRNRPQRLIGRLHQGTVNAREWIIYFCTNEEDEQVYFMSMSWSPVGESTQTYSEKFILPENRKPHATDRFILSDNLLIVLGNLGYSEVVEECREVYQRLTVYDLHTQSPDEHPYPELKRHVPEVFIIPCNMAEYLIWDSTYLVGPDENRTHFMAWSLKHGQVAWRMKPEWNVDSAEPPEEVTKATGISDTNKTVETSSVAVTQPIEDTREQWTIENFILSGDGSMLVASYGLPYFCVFSLHGRQHVGNLNEAYAQEAEDTASTVHVSNRSHTNPPGIAYNSSISNTALSFHGEWFAQSEFSAHYRTTCLTIWSLHALHNPQKKKPIGLKWRRRRLLDQSGLIALTVNGSDGVVITACLGRGLFVWCPVRSDQVHQLPMSERLDYTTDRPPSLICSRDGTKVAVSSGPRTTQITAWSIPADTTKPLQTSYFLGHAFTPNTVLELSFSFLEDVICARVQDADKPCVLRVNWFNT